ncbi:MAG: formate/nitrite transporter family protein [Pseudomonadales bacterium]|nr:formate/nitrite transporter family protein [Pseudomonadales bacterium]
MNNETINHFAAMAAKKVQFFRTHPFGFTIGAVMAGLYVGLGIILMLSVGGTVDPAYQKLVMGSTFCVALILVVFAGSELFTGHTMYMMFGYLQRQVCWTKILQVWGVVWIGNFIGALLLASLFLIGGGGNLIHEAAPALHKIAEHKIHADAFSLIARGILCNLLVCLAIWMATRCKSDAGKAIAIFWALFTFIASGYEHCVANMTIFSLALLSNHPDSITLAGAAHNLFWVTLGNTIGGSVFMGLGYWFYAGQKCPITTPNQQTATCCTKQITA